MIKSILNIGVIESSAIIHEGLENLLLKCLSNVALTLISDIEDINVNPIKKDLDLIIMNPVQIVNRLKLFKNLKSNNPDLKWFGLVYNIFDKDILAMFDEIIHMDDSKDSILRKIKKHHNKSGSNISTDKIGELTDRETAVLKEIVRGRSNKEIGNVLNISIHTVMSHRKNIIQKTNIKSQAGLTVFALTNNIISIDNI